MPTKRCPGKGAVVVGAATLALVALSAGHEARTAHACVPSVETSDLAAYNFETGTQGWSIDFGPNQDTGVVTSVAHTTAVVTHGTGALAVTLTGPGKQAASVNAPPVPPGGVVLFHIWCPSGTTGVQPFVLGNEDTGWHWYGGPTVVPQVTGAWQIFKVVYGGAAPAARLGVEFTFDGANPAAAYVDSVGWNGGGAGDTAPVSFENGSAEGFVVESPGTVAFATGSTTESLYGGGSLAVSLNAAGMGEVATYDAPIPAHSKITFNVYAGAGTYAVQPYVQSGDPDYAWTGRWFGVTPGVWNAMSLSYPGSTPAWKAGLQLFSNGAGTAFVDSIKWTDPGVYNFEDGTAQGFRSNATDTFTPVESSNERSAFGSRSLAVTLGGVFDDVAVLDPPIPPGAVASFRIFAPSGTTRIVPYVQGAESGGSRWFESSTDNPAANTWGTYSVRYTDSTPAHALGVRFYSAGSGGRTAYIDSVDWSDPATFNFEMGSKQGWEDQPGGIVTELSTSVAQAAAGGRSLAVTLSGTGEEMVRVPAPPILPGSTISFSIRVPQGTTAVQPFLEENGTWQWHHTYYWHPATDVWNTHTLTFPNTDLSRRLSRLGVKFYYDSATARTAYIDSVGVIPVPEGATCSTPVRKPDGSICDDGDPCTRSDACSNGACVGSNRDPTCTPPACVGGCAAMQDCSDLSASGAIVATDLVDTNLTVGAAEGAFQVTPSGSASYRMPLWSPPGRAGIQPSLSLTYDSGAGEGVAGVGAQITGFPLSRITRCKKTVAQDGEAEPIAFDGDTYCLDGDRLVQIGGTNEYKKEHDDLSRITANGSTMFPNGNQNVVSFKVETRDGKILTYGTTSASRLEGNVLTASASMNDQAAPTIQPKQTGAIYAWALDSVSDLAGNRMDVWYTVSELLPHIIEYTASTNLGLTGQRRITFHYDVREHPSHGWVSGFPVHETRRIRTINTFGPTALVRTCSFAYETGPVSGRDRLHSVTECDGGGVCKRPTELAWDDGDPTYQAIDLPDDLYVPTGGNLVATDLNHDGRDDLLFGNGSYALATGNKALPFGPVVAPPLNGAATTAIPFDAAMTGFPSVVLRWTVSDNAGSHPAWGMFRWQSALEPYVQQESNITGPTGGNGYLADMTGDGYPEFLSWKMYQYTDPGGQSSIKDGGRVLFINNGGTLGTALDLAIALVPQGKAHMVDATGAGKSALLVRSACANNRVSAQCPETQTFLTRYVMVQADRSTSATHEPGYLPTTLDGGSADYAPSMPFQYVFADVNGDGLADAIRIVQNDQPPAAPYVAINMGTAFRPPASWVGGDGLSGTAQRVADVNGDGLADLVTVGQGGSDLEPRIPMQARVAKPDHSFEQVDLMAAAPGQTPAPIPTLRETTCLYQSGMVIANCDGYSKTQLLDWNGDGLPDIIVPRQQTVNGWQMRLFVRRGSKPDLMTGVTDGLGKQIGVTYRAMTDSTVYTPQPTAYPQYSAVKGMGLVAAHTVTNGRLSGAWPETRRFSYEYDDARFDVRGRGFLGFARVRQRACMSESGTCLVADGDAVEHSVTYDNSTRLVLANGFERYAEAGLPKIDFVRSPIFDGDVPGIREVEVRTTYETVNQAAGGRSYITRPTEVRTEERDVLPGVTRILRTGKTTTTYWPDYYNNVLSRSTEWSSPAGPTFTDTYEVTRYRNSTLPYVLGLPEVETVTSSTPASAGSLADWGSRTTESSYYAQTGLLYKKTVAVASASQRHETYYERDAAGQVKAVKDVGITYYTDGRVASGQTRRTVYNQFDSENMYARRVTNPLNQAICSVREPSTGEVAVTRDPNRVLASKSFDGFGRVRKISQGGAGDVTTSYLAGTGQPWRQIAAMKVHTKTDGGGESYVTFDPNGKELQREELTGNDGMATTTRQYDYLGRLTAVSRPYFVTDTPVWTTYSFDGMDRVLDETAPGPAVVHHRYSGLTEWTTDDAGDVRQQIKDASGRVIASSEIAYYDRTGTPPDRPLGANTKFLYGRFGQVLKIDVVEIEGIPTPGAPPDVISSHMYYDEIGRRTELNDPDKGATGFTYNPFGDVMTETHASGTYWRNYTRDVLGRVTAESTPDGTTTFTFDAAANGIGKLAASTSPPGLGGVATTHSFDAFSRPESSTWTIDGSNYTVTRHHDAFGRVDRVDYPDTALPGIGRVSVDYGFDVAGNVERMLVGARQFWRTISRVADGQVKTEIYNNNVFTYRTYTARGQAQTIETYAADDSLIQSQIYAHDLNGNVTGRTDLTFGETFGYDLGRLSTATYTPAQYGPGAPPTVTTVHQYDGHGNIKSRSWDGPNAGSVTYFYNGPQPHAATTVNGQIYVYDQKGNQIQGPDRTVAYTAFDLPRTINPHSEAGPTTISYDSSHARVKKQRSGHSTIYVGGLYEKRTEGETTTHVLYIPGSSRIVGQIKILAAETPTTTWQFLHDDALGSVTAITDDQSTAVEHMEYAPFGARRLGASSDVRLGFTLHEQDDEHGLVNMKGRIYDPAIERFLTPDPIIGNPMSGQSYNAYSYVGNNPVTMTDPTGMLDVNCSGMSCADVNLGALRQDYGRMAAEYQSKGINVGRDAQGGNDGAWDPRAATRAAQAAPYIAGVATAGTPWATTYDDSGAQGAYFAGPGAGTAATPPPPISVSGDFPADVQARGAGRNPLGAYTGADIGWSLSVTGRRFAGGVTTIEFAVVAQPKLIFTEYAMPPGVQSADNPLITLGEHEQAHAWMTRAFYRTENLQDIAGRAGIQFSFSIAGQASDAQVRSQLKAEQQAISSYFGAVNTYLQNSVLHPGTQGSVPVYVAP